MVTREAEEIATTWALAHQWVLRFYKEWAIGDQQIISAIAYDEDGVGHVHDMDRDGNMIMVR